MSVRNGLLALLTTGPRHGYELKKELEDRTGSLWELNVGQVYTTLSRLERDGLVERTVHPVIPPKVEYRLTDLGNSLGEAFCGVWHWAGDNLDRVEAARKAFDDRG